MRKVGNNYHNLQGPVTIGSPTGGYESAGSINAVALFINGVAVVAGTGAGGVTSITGTANQVTVSPTTGAVVVGLPQNVIIPTPSSGNSLVVVGASGNDVVSITSVGSANGLDIANAGATNRVCLQVSQTSGNSTVIGQDGSVQILPGTTNGDFCIRSGQTIRLSANGYVASQLTIATAGNVTIAAPSSGQALTVNGVASSFSTAVTSPNTAGVSNGLKIQAGTNTSDNALLVQNAAAASMFAINGNGNVTILAPASGIALTVNGSGSGQSGLTVADTGNVNGANIQLTGNGATTPTKFIRVQGGVFQILNSGYTGSLLSITDTGSATLTPTGTNNGLIATLAGNATGVQVTGIAATQFASLSMTQSGQNSWFLISPASSNNIGFFTLGSSILTLAPTGVTIPAPVTAGTTALVVTASAGAQGATINGAANSFALEAAAPNTASSSYGLYIQAGTNTTDSALQISNAAASGLLRVYGDGSVVVGAPTGANKGLGTINATGLFVNGVAVGAGATTLNAVALTTQSVTSSTTYVADTSLTLALTAGKYYQIYAQVPFKNASGVTGGGANFAFTYSGTGGILWGDDLSSSSTIGQPQVQGVSPTTFNSFQNIAPNAFDTGGNMWVFFGTMFAGSVGGNLLVNWAQNTSSATATIRQIGAIMTAIQLN